MLIVLKFDTILPKIDFICQALCKKTHGTNTTYYQNSAATDNFWQYRAFIPIPVILRIGLTGG
jgi:hypothetical protein